MTTISTRAPRNAKRRVTKDAPKLASTDALVTRGLEALHALNHRLLHDATEDRHGTPRVSAAFVTLVHKTQTLEGAFLDALVRARRARAEMFTLDFADGAKVSVYIIDAGRGFRFLRMTVDAHTAATAKKLGRQEPARESQHRDRFPDETSAAKCRHVRVALARVLRDLERERSASAVAARTLFALEQRRGR